MDSGHLENSPTIPKRRNPQNIDPIRLSNSFSTEERVTKELLGVEPFRNDFGNLLSELDE